MNPQVSPAELADFMATGTAFCLLDVREPQEHEFVALPDSVLIPLSQLRDRLEEIASWKAKPVVVYCHHGIRSLHAIALLQSSGFQQLHNLTGGIDRWSAEVDVSLPRY